MIVTVKIDADDLADACQSIRDTYRNLDGDVPVVIAELVGQLEWALRRNHEEPPEEPIG